MNNTYIEPFDVDSAPSTAGTRWTKWVKRLNNLFIVNKTTDAREKRACLLHYAGESVFDIFENLPDTGDEKDYDAAVNALNSHFSPSKNIDYEVLMFRDCSQMEEESLDQFYIRLRKMAQSCDFQDKDRELKSQIIGRCKDRRLRQRALETQNLTLDKLLKIGRTMEISDTQQKQIEKQIKKESVKETEGTANKMYHTKSWKKKPWNDKTQYKDGSSYGKKTCYFCGNNYPHKDGRNSCPAFGKVCSNCGRNNHFARCCKAKKKSVKYMAEQRDSSQEDTEDYAEQQTLFTCRGDPKKTPFIKVLIGNTPVNFMIDSGSSVNILDAVTFGKLKTKYKLQNSSMKVYTYGSNKPMKMLGKFKADVICLNQEKTRTNMITHVINGNYGSLMSYETALELNLIKMNVNQVTSETKNESSDFEQKLVMKYEDRFKGIGKVKDYKAILHIDRSVAPVALSHRRIPFHLREKVSKELKYLQENDIIEKVKGPTPWVSPIVTPPKPNKPDEVRICVDMRNANKAIHRERHMMPTIDDLIVQLNGAKVFSKLDLNKGYHQIELDEKSRYITTFSTNIGLFRYKRLNFGTNSAAELFQNVIQQIIKDVPGCLNISDDIIVYGENEKTHDRNLDLLMKTLRRMNLTLNRKKCEFRKRRIEFFGFVFSDAGISVQESKIKAVKEAKPPKTKTEVRSFLGLTNYCARAINNYSTLTEPLRELTLKNKPWEWKPKHEETFEKLKRSLKSDKIMSYYDPKKETELIVDASPVGCGAILVQNTYNERKIISYASKSLTPTEKRYSQTEREALAIVWGCEHFNLYLRGRSEPFHLITDHKPLELIFNNPNSKPPPRIERWNLRLQPYNFRVKYRSGSDNPADYFSRHPVNSTDLCEYSEESEAYVNMLAEDAIPIAMTTEEVIEESQKDEDIQEFKKMHKENKLDKTDNLSYDLRRYCTLKDEITIVSNGLLLKGNKIIIPKSLRSKAVRLAHEGHQGIVKTKKLIREKIWFPGIDKAVNEAIAKCLYCQAATISSKNLEPLKMTPLPDHAWENISIDFCGPFYTGEYLLVLIDDYSRYPIVEIVKSTSAETVIPVLDKIFAMFGIPSVVKSDNGPPFNSSKFANFAKFSGFKHRKITPYWPKANSEAERFMKTLNKTMRILHAERKPWRKDLHIFLRNYRATPHSTTDISPSEIIFGRKMKIKLPEIVKHPKQNFIRRRDKESKLKMKEYADRKYSAKSSKIKTGNMVIVLQPKQGKLSLPYKPKPYKVIKIKGSMITARNNDHTITRNSSFFKLIDKSHKFCESRQPYYLPPLDDDDEQEISPNNIQAQSTPSNSQLESPNQSFNSQYTSPYIIPQRRYNLRRDVRRPQYLTTDYVTLDDDDDID